VIFAPQAYFFKPTNSSRLLSALAAWMDTCELLITELVALPFTRSNSRWIFEWFALETLIGFMLLAEGC